MAVPPTVPTSFVPRSSSSTPFRSHGFDFGGAFAFLGYGALVLSLLMAAGVFGYQWYLSGVEAGKKADLQQAEASIDSATVQSFIELNNQLSQGKELLDHHVIFSNVLALFETLSPVTVRLQSLHVSINDTHTGTLSASGMAANFNGLAALSSILGKDGHIKNAIFSGIAIEKTGSVSFALSADVDPSLLSFTASGAPAAPAAATGTPPQQP